MVGIDRRRAGAVAGCFGLVWLVALLAPAGAAARETRAVAHGRFELTVGFLDEPAYEGEPNGLYLRVYEVPTPLAEPANGVAAQATPAATPEASPAPAASPTPVPGSELTAEVAYGPDVQPLKLEPAPQDGVYRAVFVPTQPGDYVFRIKGKLGGEDIAEEFRTSPQGIPPVVGVAGLQFPQEIPVGQGLLAALDEREAEAKRARTLGMVGIALGVVGLLAGGIAVVLSRRPPPSGMP